MKYYAFLKDPAENKVTPCMIQKQLPGPNIDGVTLTTHATPWVVYLHCHEELSEQERSELAESIANI